MTTTPTATEAVEAAPGAVEAVQALRGTWAARLRESSRLAAIDGWRHAEEFADRYTGPADPEVRDLRRDSVFLDWVRGYLLDDIDQDVDDGIAARARGIQDALAAVNAR